MLLAFFMFVQWMKLYKTLIERLFLLRQVGSRSLPSVRVLDGLCEKLHQQMESYAFREQGNDNVKRKV
jgi:hypothetical protein